ncbi:MAG: hypothetical protein IT292_09140 [Deltaproteobacteria bacterium]|nr:hypothetical protein [Deltaproteobacteria bacterium]
MSGTQLVWGDVSGLGGGDITNVVGPNTGKKGKIVFLIALGEVRLVV